MRSISVLVVTLLLALLAACGEKVAFELPSTTAVTVYNMGTGSQRSIQPQTDAHQKLVVWAVRNQDGWQPYLATPPAKGIIVRAEKLDLQFIGEHVLLHTRHEIFTKKVTLSEYTFLFN